MLSGRIAYFALPLIATLAVGTAFYLTQSDTAESQSNPLQKLWLEAEAETNPTRAIGLWENLYTSAQNQSGNIAEGIPVSDAKKMLFEAYLKSAKLVEAEKLLPSFTDTREQAWSNILLARAMMNSNSSGALKLLNKAAEIAATLTPAKTRSYTMHGVLATALSMHQGKPVFDWDGAELATKMIPFITSAWHRADIAQKLALQTPAPEGKLQAKLHRALQLPQEKEKEKESALWSIYQQARKDDLFFVALDALSGIYADKVQQKEIYEWYKVLLEKKEYSRAISAAERLDDDRRAASAWSRLARYYHEAGQDDRATEARNRSFAAATHTHYDDDRIEAFTSIAEQIAKSGDIEMAMKALAQIPDGTKGKSRAYGKLIKAISESKQVARAEEMLASFSTDDGELKNMVYSAVAKAMAQEKRPQEAMDLLDSAGDVPFIPQRDNAYYAIAKGYAKTKDFSAALEVLEKITDPRIKEEAGKFIRAKKADQQSGIDTESPVLSAEEKIAADALALAEKGDIAAAARKMKTIENDFLRVEKFRELAELQARKTDYYGMLGSKQKERFLNPANTESADAISPQEEAILEDSLNKLSQKKSSTVDIRTAPESALGVALPPFPDAEKLSLSKKDIRKALPLSTANFSVKRIYFGNNYFVNSKFKVAIGQAEINYRERNLTPEVILLERGTATLPQVYDALRAQGQDDFIERNGKTYTLRRAIVISRNAKLVIDGTEVANLQQSRQAGAILVNSGELHIADANLIGWDEDKQAPHFLTVENGYDFRPFINGWSGSKTYMGGSNSIALGYKKSKSFGLTMTMGPKKMVDNILFQARRPTGILVDNSFNNSYYGYYAYEADNVVLVGNEYKNGVIYGIDPHDRSQYLTMAFNTAYDSQKKHGIIISREVDNSSYIGNLSFDNHGSGFMIDRMSNGTYIYGNTSFGNGSDGLTLFESSCNLMASNHFFDNHSVGVRVRNSHDNGIFYNRFDTNRQGGIYAYSNILEGEKAQSHRDFTMDPYAAVAGITMVGNYFEKNGAGILADNIAALTLRGNRFINQSPKGMQGAWFRNHPYLESQYDLAEKGVIMTDACPTGKWQPQVKCRWREQGVFRGDGQRDFGQRITASPCNQNKKEV